MNNDKTSIKHIIMLTGAFCAFYMGVGFAGGQEILQFYTAFGIKGLLGLTISMIIFCIFAYNIQVNVRRERDTLTGPSDILMFYLGPKAGNVFSYLLIASLLGDCIMKIAGAGATVEEYFGLPNWSGRVFILLLVGVTILFGLNKILDIMGVAGPIIIAFMVVVAIIAIAKAPYGVIEGSSLVVDMNFTKGGSNWFVGGIKYAGNVLTTVLPIWIINGKMSNNIKEAKITTFSGLGALLAACLLMISAQLMNISLVGGTQIPNLILAKTYAPVMAIVFSVIILLGIYCSVAADLWYIICKFFEEKSKGYYVFTLVLTILLFLVTGFLPFSNIVNIMYSVMFWIGMALFIVIVVRTIMKQLGSNVDAKYLEAIRREHEEHTASAKNK